MKGVLHYLFLVGLVFTVSLEALYTIQQNSLLQYSTSEDLYVSNNPNGIILSTEIIEKVEETNDLLVISEDSSGRIQINNFSDIQVVSGQVPTNFGEYLVPENASEACEAEDATQVGTYAETLNFNGYGCLFFLDSLEETFVTQIQASDLSGSELAELLIDYGFIEVSSENIDKVIKSDMLALISLILRIFIALLLITGVVGWLTLAGQRIGNEKRNIQMLQHLGGSPLVVSWAYVAVNKKMWFRVFGIHLIIYLLVACGAYFFSISSRPYLFALTWLCTVIGVVVSFLILVMCISYLRPLPVVKFPAYLLEVLLVCVGVGGWYLSSNLFSIIIALILVLLLQLRKRNVIDMALFSRTGIVSGTMLVLLSLVAILCAGVFGAAVSALNKQEAAIETTLPYNTQIITQDLPEEIAGDLYEHYYINPIDGIEYEGESFFPLIYSTELSKYQSYLDNDDSLSTESILVGRGIAVKSGLEVGDTITINGIQVTVTHIVNTEQYSGMMIYLSDEKFIEIFGSSGTTYYFSDLSVEELEQYFSDENTTITDRDTYREYYNNSVVEIMLMLMIFCFIVVIVSGVLIYALLSLFLNSVEWKVNLLRGFGLSKREFAGSLIRMLMLLCLGSLFVCIVVSRFVADILSMLILSIADSYFEIAISGEVIAGIVVTYVILCLALILPRVLKLNKLSIYQQYLRTRPQV